MEDLKDPSSLKPYLPGSSGSSVGFERDSRFKDSSKNLNFLYPSFFFF
ncbi:uncharacterized protein CELE_Y48A6C.8 [Caenorhabditis elegans]|uniref:Uncharacterized protein n=1 Tax=Caenorhabditis elegans TaxID=6239 RepID=I2HAI5_CAEEL|nr:Uncharacterized protein CELE_Y48A6C.8 [Caenorhabditis elegans]CCH63913.1 Uncharacterized protein CELE_Y48A6C.8 [Caenorhabditis elegans]|eukprot:NP_001263728.1 Uncharacterized protein CELE_Y48A6C.8 [Caenorhabditis elegans]